MTQPEKSPMPQSKAEASSLRLIATLGGISLLSGFLIVMVVKVTEARIIANKQYALEQAVYTVLPGAVSKAAFTIGPDGVSPADSEAPEAIYAGYDKDGKLVGVAIRAGAQGYQDIVRILYGYDPATDAVIGMTVLESKETPGLGDRIGSDSTFLANFEALDVKLNESGDGLANAIVLMGQGERQPWEIDGITGATISSRAVATMMNETSQKMLPIIKAHADDLRKVQ